MFVSGYVRDNVIIDLKIDEGRVRLKPVPEGQGVVKIAPGMAPKAELKIDSVIPDKINSGSNHFILKHPKTRSFLAIFGSTNIISLFKSEGATPRKAMELYYKYAASTFEKNRSTLHCAKKIDPGFLQLFEKMFQHVRETLTLAAFGEVVYSEVARALFPRSLRTPEMFLHIDETGSPYVLSRFVDGFNEFMHKRLVSKEGGGKEQMVATLKERKAKLAKEGVLPKRDDLAITAVEDRLLGKMLAIALITNHWDLFNNICLANSGCLGELNSSELVVIVDCGNAFSDGFGGRSGGEATFLNPDVMGLEDRDAINGHKHVFPFDREFPIALPRQLVPDLFDFSSHAFFKGFQSAILDVSQALVANPDCIQSAIHCSLDKVTENSSLTVRGMLGGGANPKSTEQLLHRSTLLDRSFYKFNSEKKPSCSEGCDDSYTLESVLKSRVSFLAEATDGIATERERHAHESPVKFKQAMEGYIDRFNQNQLLKFKRLQATNDAALKKQVYPKIPSNVGFFKSESQIDADDRARAGVVLMSRL